MSKAKKTTLASIKEQMKALQEAQVQEEQRIKDGIAAGITSDAIEKLGAFSEADVKRIGTILSGYVDKCIKQFETDKAQKKAKAESAKAETANAVEEEIPEVPEETEGATEAPQVKSNYGYQQNGYQQSNGTY